MVFFLGHDDSIDIKAISKPGYSSFGMQLSNDGLILFRVLFPTSVIYVQGKEPEKIEASLMHIFLVTKLE